MTDAFVWLIIASIVIWLGLGLYLGFLALAQKKLRRRCHQLEMLIYEREE